jgi:hypothetical protein
MDSSSVNTLITGQTNGHSYVKGSFGVGTISKAAMLTVNQLEAAAEIPSLKLSQLDVSEEMIEFDSTIGVGNAIEAVGAKSLTPTHFIKITIPGGLTVYLPCGTIA